MYVCVCVCVYVCACIYIIVIAVSHLRGWIPATPAAKYAWQIYGKITVKTRGTYTFCSTSDDGSLVYVNNKKVCVCVYVCMYAYTRMHAHAHTQNLLAMNAYMHATGRRQRRTARRAGKMRDYPIGWRKLGCGLDRLSGMFFVDVCDASVCRSV